MKIDYNQGTALNYEDGNPNVKGTETITVPVKEVGTTIPSGFKVGWMEGVHDDGRKIEVTCGAGVGSTYLNIEVGDRQFVIDVGDILAPVVALTEAPDGK